MLPSFLCANMFPSSLLLVRESGQKGLKDFAPPQIYSIMIYSRTAGGNLEVDCILITLELGNENRG